MFIGVDGYNMALPHGTGVARYGRRLARAVRGLGHNVSIIYGLNLPRNTEPMLAEVLLQTGGLKQRRSKLQNLLATLQLYINRSGTEIKISGNVRDVNNRVSFADHVLNFQNLYKYSRYFFRFTGQLMEIDVPGLDVMHWTYPLPVKVRNCKNIYTIHDTVPFSHPNLSLDRKDESYRLCKRIVEDSDKIVTVSNRSRADIINIFSVKDELKVVNTYQDCDCRLVSAERSMTVVHSLFGLDYKGFLLFVGAWEPKKNLGKMLRAYINSGVSSDLVVVSGSGWGNEDEKAFFSSLPNTTRKNKIHFVRYVPDDTLGELIKGCKFLLFPSLYEGFGLPLLEAMSAGSAVITANTGSLPEIAGDGALLVDPHDELAMEAAITRLDRDDDLRARLERQGRARAAFFDTQTYQERLSSLYMSL